MVSNKKSDWPPPGWKIEIKVCNNGRNYKCYTNSKTGQKFYSKAAVLRCIKNGRVANQSSCITKGHAKKNQGNKQMHQLEATDFFDLPSGWTVEWRLRHSGPKKGTKYKCFIDPSTGSKFYSMPEVDRYLKSIKGNAGLSIQKERVLIERMSDEELPSGWIKEMRIKLKGNEAIRRNTFYIDSVSGLVFRSKLDVTHYLETGEVSKHVYQRKNDSNNSRESTPAKASPTCSSKREQTRKSLTTKQPSADGVSPQKPIVTPAETGGASGKTRSSSARVTRAFSRETNLEQSNLFSEPVNKAQAIVPTKQLFTDGVSPEKPIVTPAETGGHKDAASGKTRSSSTRVTRAFSRETNLEQNNLFPEPVNKAQAIVPTKQLSTDGVSPKKPILTPPEIGGHKNASSMKTRRSSARVTRAFSRETNLEQSNLLPEPVNKVQAIVPSKQLSTDGISPKKPILTPPEIGGHEDALSVKTGRSSARVTRAFSRATNLEQTNLSPEPVNKAQALVPTKQFPTDGVSPKKPILTAPEIGVHKDLSVKPGRSSARVTRAFSRETNLEQTNLSPEPVAIGASPKKPTILTPPETGGHKGAASVKTRRSSARVTHAFSCETNLGQSTLHPEPVSKAQEIVPPKPLVDDVSSIDETKSVTKLAQPKIQDADKQDDDKVKEEEPSSRDKLDVELPGCSNGKYQMSKRKTSDRKEPSMPFRSSKRLAGVTAEVEFHPIPIEHARLGISTGKSSKSKEIFTQNSVPSDSQGRTWLLDVDPQNVLSSQEEKVRTVNVDSQPVHARLAASTGKSSKSKEIFTQNSVPSDSQGRTHVLSSQEEKARTVNVDSQPVHATRVEFLNKIDSVNQEYVKEVILQDSPPPGFSHFSQVRMNQSLRGPPDTQPEGKIEKSPLVHPPGSSHFSQVRMNQSLRGPPDTQPESKIERSPPVHPPGFSHFSQVRMNQSLRGPPDTQPEGKIEKSPLVHEIPEVQPNVLSGSKSEKTPGGCPTLDELGVGLERDEQPGSQFCLSSPLWSDPCLEFAFKTLTGAIPLDDNVAIHDYIQHQLRTSEDTNNKRSSGVGAPSFCQNDEIKLSSPLPGDVSLTNSIGFDPHKSTR